VWGGVVKLLLFSAVALDWGTMPIGMGRVVQRERAGTLPGVEPLPYCPHVYRYTLSVGCLMMHFWQYVWLRHVRLKLYTEQLFWGTFVFLLPPAVNTLIGLHVTDLGCFLPYFCRL
jgi:hypothetical protein